MSVKLRLQRRGAKGAPFYRIVATDSRSPRNGRFLEIVGTYDPNQEPAQLRLKLDRVEYWIGVGAQPTDTVASLLRRAKRNPESLTPVGPAARKPRAVPAKADSAAPEA